LSMLKQRHAEDPMDEGSKQARICTLLPRLRAVTLNEVKGLRRCRLANVRQRLRFAVGRQTARGDFASLRMTLT
jgi:hypothetical protein